MLSGIGQKEQLREHGIPLVKELSGVGKNLQDHIISDVSYTYDRQVRFAIFTAKWRSLRGLQAGFQHRMPNCLGLLEKVFGGKFK